MLNNLPPRVLFVNLTRRCNVECPRCYLTPAHRAQRAQLDPALLHKALSDPFFRAYEGPVLVMHQGGEPQLVGRACLTEYVDAARDAAPHARQTLVTNLLAAPPWLFDLAHAHFGGLIETTWAVARKSTLDGDEAAYQERFADSLSQAVAAGINCPINVELNAETVAAGPDALLDMMVATGASACDFDLSFDFQAFRKAPRFASGGLPLVPPTTPYAQVAAYLLAFRRRRALRGLEGRVFSHNLVPIAHRGADMPFNTQAEMRFVTLNPDGTVTTIPLYSDVPQTYIGSLRRQTLAECLAHPNRAARAAAQEARLVRCGPCPHTASCQGGPGHAPWTDGSGECAGLRSVLDRLVQDKLVAV